MKSPLMKERLYLSLGENCLTDGILKRHNLKSYSTPFSHCRTNIDYALFLENDSYSNLLDKEDLLYDFVGESKVVRNNAIKNSDSIYDPMHTRGFEFTHHDVIENESHRESYKRKIDRLKKDKGNRDITFFYHYRLNLNFNIDLLLKKAENYLDLYSINKCECELVIFAQEIIKDSKERGIRKMKRNDNIHVYFLKTLEVWGGNNPDLLWAKKDDDLIKTMLEEIVDFDVIK